MNQQQPQYGAPTGQQSVYTTEPHPSVLSGGAPQSTAAFGAAPATGAYDNNAGYGTHPQQQHAHAAGHGTHQPGQHESTIDKVKDHLVGKHSQDPKNGGGFGAGYTGNDHGHSNVHPQPHGHHHHQQQQPVYGEANTHQGGVMDKVKQAVSGDKQHTNDPAYYNSGAYNNNAASTGAHGATNTTGATGTYGANTTGTIGAMGTTGGLHSHGTQGTDTYGTSNLHDPTHNNNMTTAGTGAYTSTGASSNPSSSLSHHHGSTTGGLTGAGHTGQHHHDSHNPNHTGHGHGADGTTKPSVGDKLSGKADVLIGKLTGNEAKVAQGEAKQVFGKEATEHGTAAAHAHQGSTTNTNYQSVHPTSFQKSLTE